MTEALFEKVEVLGVQSVTIHPTPEADAHGWSDAFGSEPMTLNRFSTDGRGERCRDEDYVLIDWQLSPAAYGSVSLGGV